MAAVKQPMNRLSQGFVLDLKQAHMEALSWRILTETARKSPKRLRIYELHPGGGQYDALSLFTTEDIKVAMLNRPGSFHVSESLRDPGVPAANEDYLKIWDEYILCSEFPDLVTKVCSLIGLAVPKKLPASTPPIVTYRLISELLAWGIGRDAYWQCRSGYNDSSGWDGCHTREHLFEPFEEASERLRVADDGDLFNHPPYRFWFLMKEDEPLLCFDTTGIIWNRAGKKLDSFQAYRKEKKLWPVIMQIAADILP